MSSRERLSGLLAGAVAGIAGGFFGVGGGIVMIPIMTGALGFTQHQAHGTSLAVMGITALVSLTVYAAHGNVAWLTAGLIALTSLWTARYGARLASRTPALQLTRAFGIFLVLVAIRLLWRPSGAMSVSLHEGGARVAFDLVLGLAVGVLSGYMGVGGGILIVPALTLLYGMPQQLAQGTSLAVILVTGPAGAIEHARHGNVLMSKVPLLAIGAAAGGLCASALAQQVPRETLARAFALFLLLNGVRTWLRAGRARSSAPVRSDARGA